MTAPHVAAWNGAPVGVAAAGAVNGVGFDARQTWAFWRADVTPIAETPFRADSGDRAGMIAVRTLPPRLAGTARLTALALDALGQLDRAVEAVAGRQVLLVALAARYADDGPRRAERREIEVRLRRWLADRGSTATLQLVPGGHAGLARALVDAGSLLARGSVDAVVAGGVDSWWDPAAFEELVAQERLFCAENVDGLVPGEGAAFVLLAGETAARRAGLRLRARLLAAAADREPSPAHGAAPCAAVGLGRALRAATEGGAPGEARVDWMLGDVTNEGWRAHELQLALPRAMAPGGLDRGRGRRELVVTHPRMDMLPLRFGDLGAATLPTGMVVAAEAFARGDPSAARCLLFASSYGPERGALLLGSPDGGDHRARR